MGYGLYHHGQPGPQTSLWVIGTTARFHDVPSFGANFLSLILTFYSPGLGFVNKKIGRFWETISALVYDGGGEHKMLCPAKIQGQKFCKILSVGSLFPEESCAIMTAYDIYLPEKRKWESL